MKYLRNWDLPTLDEPIIEHLDQPIGWGVSVFWYCSNCRSIYASAWLSPEDCSHRQWRAVSGLCLTCPPHPYQIRGTIDAAITIGWNVPIEVALYQLNREVDFLCHPNHPHNKEAQ